MILPAYMYVLSFEFWKFTKVENGNLCLTKYVISSLQILLEKSFFLNRKLYLTKNVDTNQKSALNLFVLKMYPPI